MATEKNGRKTYKGMGALNRQNRATIEAAGMKQAPKKKSSTRKKTTNKIEKAIRSRISKIQGKKAKKK